MKNIKRYRALIAGLLSVVFLICSIVNLIPAIADNKTEERVGGSAVEGSKVDPIIYDFNFLSTPVDGTYYAKPETMGWKVVSGASQTTMVENGVWSINVQSTKVILQGEADVAVEAALYPSFRIKLLNNTAAASATLFFKTDKDKENTNSKSLTLDIQPNDNVYREYLFDMSNIDTWTGMINQVEIVFENRVGNDSSVGQLNIDYFSFNPDTVPADVVFDFSENFNGIENITNAQNTGEDVLYLTPTAANASFETVDKLGLDASYFNYFKIALQNNTSSKRMRVSFITSTSRIWDNEKSVLLDALKVSDSGLSYYAFNMTSCPLWKGKIEKFRITFEDTKANDGSIAIPAIGIFTGVILEDQVFDFSKDHDGWTSGLNTSLSQKDDALNIEINGIDAYYTSPDVAINADEMRYITLKLKNSTASSAMRIQWINEGAEGFDDIRSQNILITPNSDMQEYVVALGDHQRWEGTVTRLKITPALYSTKGTQQISSITFSQNEDASFSGRVITEGYLEFAEGWSHNANGGQFTGDNDKTGTTSPASMGTGCAVELSNDGSQNTIGKGAPVEAWRSVAKYEDGYIQWPIMVNLSDVNTKGTSIKLINTETGNDAIRFTLENGALNVALPQGEKKITDLQSGKLFSFMLYMNMAKHTYDIWIGHKLVERDVPFTTAEGFDKIYLGTTGEDKLLFGYTGSMYRPNELFETFGQAPRTLADSEKYEVIGDVMVSSKNNGGLPSGQLPAAIGAGTNVLSVGNTKASSFKADFVPTSNVIESNVRFAIMRKEDGMKLELLDGTSTTAAIIIKGNDILYLDADGKEQVLWKKFLTNVVYSLKIRTYTELGKVEYSINGCSSKNGGKENVNVPAVSKLQSGAATVNALSVSTNNQGIWYVEQIRILDYTPSVVPAVESTNDTENGYIGVNAWMSNNDRADNFYQNTQRIVNKESVIGYFDDFNKTSTDWQMKYLAENGIDFISYFFIEYSECALDTYLDYADYKNEVNFAYQLITWCVNSQAEYENKLWPFLLERLFRNPNYIKYNNKPILFAYEDLAGDISAALKTLNSLAVKEGFDGIIFVNVTNTARTELFKAAKDYGYDYVSNYWQVVTPKKVNDAIAAARKAEIEYIIAPGVGADSRCWSTLDFSQSGVGYIRPTISQFYNTLARAKEIMATEYSSDSLASKMIFAENWSEFGEGHSIMPYGDIRFGYINQIRRVFGSNTDNNYKNTYPSGKLDGMFSLGWNKEQLADRGFEAGADNWKSSQADLTVVESTEFYYLKGAASVTDRSSKDGRLYQDITSAILNNGKGAAYDMSAYLKASNDSYSPPDDSLRYFSFLSAADESGALTYSSSNNKLTTLTYDENNENQRFAILKVPETKYYQIFVANTLKFDKEGKVIGGKLVASSVDPAYAGVQDSYLRGIIYVLDFAQVNEDNVNSTYFVLPKEIYQSDIISINAGPDQNDRPLFQFQGLGKDVRLIINWNDKNQRWVAKYRNPSEVPLSYRTTSNITLEITDSQGTHSYSYDGLSTLFGSVNNAKSVKVDWTGELKRAVLYINGDTATNEKFFVDECQFRLVPKQYYVMPSYTVIGGLSVNDNGEDNGNEEEAGIIYDIVANSGGSIDIELSSPTVISKDVFKAAKDNDVGVTFKLTDSTRTWYSFSFKSDAINNTQVDLNTKINFISRYKSVIERAVGDNGTPFYISFEHKNNLPGKATVSAYVGNKYESGQSLSLYEYLSKDGKIKRLQKNITVNEDGYIVFDVEKAAEYFLVESNVSVSSPNTGYDANIYGAIIFAAFSLVCLLLCVVFSKKGGHSKE